MTTQQLKAIATEAPRQRTIVDYLDNKRVHDGLAAVAGKFLSADRMLRLCVNAVKKTPLLLKCDPETVLGAMMASAALGLEPNTVQQQAFLIPYKARRQIGGQWVDVYECQFQVGYRGFVTLAYRSPHIQSFTSGAIHDGDLWENEAGSKTFLRHSVALKDRGPLIGSYAHAHLTSGREVSCVLPLDEILKIRGRSETFRSLTRAVENAESDKDRARAQAKLAETPWVMWEDDMAAKSAIKKLAKGLPIASGDLLLTAAGELDSRSDVGDLDLRSLVTPEAVIAITSEGEAPPVVGTTAEEPPPSEPPRRGPGRPPGSKNAPKASESSAPPLPPAVSAAGTSQAMPPPTFDIAAKLERMRKVTDRDVLAAMADDLRQLPDSPEKESALDIYRELDAKLAML
jgi:recombination protein RecT